jgi:hypothetical protein
VGRDAGIGVKLARFFLDAHALPLDILQLESNGKGRVEASLSCESFEAFNGNAANTCSEEKELPQLLLAQQLHLLPEPLYALFLFLFL